ncbi:MAG TPA: nitrate- and nitrite sensing domain-containing protein [Streptosporangiaceae bacterium]|nr:nitrate- and nitrite sensing domain-containing protein [Streptosporangiaceae bacterium]
MRAKGKKNSRVAATAAANGAAADDGTSVFPAARSSAFTNPEGPGAGPAMGSRGMPGPEPDSGPPGEASGQPVDAPPPAGQDRGGLTQAPGRKATRRQLKNWRVRSRLLLLVAIPTVTALVFGGFFIYSSVRSAQTYSRVHQLALLGQDVTQLVQSLEDERDLTVYYIGLGANGGRVNELSADPGVQQEALPQLTSIREHWNITDRYAAVVRGLARQINGSYPVAAQQAAAAMLDALDPTALSSLRNAATTTQLPLLVVVQKYGTTITTLLDFNADIAQGGGDPTLAQMVNVLGLVSLMKQDASDQRGILAAALLQGSFQPGQLAALQNSVSSQQTTQQAFNAIATPSQSQLLNGAQARSDAGPAASAELQALSLVSALATTPGASLSLAKDATTPDDWYADQSNVISFQMGSVERTLMGDVIDRAETLRKNAITDAAIVGAVVLLVLALGLMFTIIIGRSMVRPLRRLRADALSIAGVQLPGIVRRLSESEGEEGDLEIKPIDVDSTDEIGEVARAFDAVHAEAVRLASNEARLRGNVNAMFVNLSRRSQSLVERQIHLIDDLEQGEQDSERLGSLFRLDHLATRMRRNSENLLVLAGYEASRRWTQPVALVDVLRAAVSEIEHYERVVLNVQPGIAVRGQVVNDVVHLLAELVENATAFSSAQTQVNVSGHLLNSGGVLLDITDQGVGMAADEMSHANWRLDNPPVVDVSVSRRMGLFVVARLASRHGIRVRLRPAPSGGLTALIWLPDETVTHEATDAPHGLRRFELDSTAGATGSLGGLRGFSPDSPDVTDSRTAAQEAVARARAPRFMAINPDLDSAPKVPEQAGPAEDGRPAADGNLGTAGGGIDPLPVRSKDNGTPPARGNGMPAPDSGLAPARPDEPSTAPSDEAEPVFGAPTRSLADELGAITADQDWWPGKHAEPGSGSSRSGPDAPFGLTSRPARVPGGTTPDDVIVPPAASMDENRLPIFESVESDWFRRGRQHIGASRTDDGAGEEIATGWSSPVDEGWRAAEAAESPTSAGVTAAGLPRRVPQANLVPGSAAESERDQGPDLVRSAAATRQRMTSFQRGTRQGRAALQSEEVSSGGEDDAT